MIPYIDQGPKGEEQERGRTKKIFFEKLMAEKFPNSMKTINHKSKNFSELQAQETFKKSKNQEFPQWLSRNESN